MLTGLIYKLGVIVNIRSISVISGNTKFLHALYFTNFTTSANSRK